MNIVYISHLSKFMFAGPNYSVPAQIKSQSKYDNVFWWNLTDAIQDEWVRTGFFHSRSEFNELLIEKLPAPFDNPDLVVFEAFYYIDDYKLSLECRKRKIPYIIVPRSALTHQGQKQKRIKKIIANKLLFIPMTKHAISIQYLTEQEKKDSGKKWCDRDFIIPNGIAVQETKDKNDLSNEYIHGISIGRVAIYQKGLDLLLQACCEIRKELIENRVVIDIYGPDHENNKNVLNKKIANNRLDRIIQIHDGIVGDKKKEILEDSDFFILTSRFEGMPMALIEALSYGLPCLVTTGTNMADEIQTYDAGWISNVSIDGIKNCLRDMIASSHDLRIKRKNAKKLAMLYDWDSIAQRTHEVYLNLITNMRSK